VAAEVARRLDAPLDVLVARKLGAPMAAELAIGAVTADGGQFLNQALIGRFAVPEPYVAAVTEAQRAEAQRQELRFRASRRPVAVRGHTAILVDDGLATGATARAAVRSLRGRQPARVVFAVPVGSAQACTALRTEADEVVCPFEQVDFEAVGRYYVDFSQTTDDEVQELLALARGGSMSVDPAGRR
jgi:predicted phosphoribosyltransferase